MKAKDAGWDPLANGEPLILGKQQWPDVKPHIQRVLGAVNVAVSGSYAEVDIPYRK